MQLIKYVAEEDEESLINFLSVTRPNMNLKFTKGRAILHLFVSFSLSTTKFNCLIHLINNGANMEAEDDNGITPILLASRHKNLEYIKFLVDIGANFQKKDKKGNNCLHHAVQQGSALNEEADVLRVANYLIDKGVSCEERNKEGRSALHIAAMKGRVKTVGFFLDRDARSDSVQETTNTDSCSAVGLLSNISKNILYSKKCCIDIVSALCCAPICP